MARAPRGMAMIGAVAEGVGRKSAFADTCWNGRNAADLTGIKSEPIDRVADAASRVRRWDW